MYLIFGYKSTSYYFFFGTIRALLILSYLLSMVKTYRSRFLTRFCGKMTQVVVFCITLKLL